MSKVALVTILLGSSAGMNALPGAETGYDVASWIQSTGGSFQKDKAGQISEVDLTSTWITDDDLAKIAQLKQLRKLNLSYTKITDLGLEHLRPLQNVVDRANEY